MGDEDFECYAQFIDGSYDTSSCGCPDCRQAEDDEIEHQAEMGYISDEQARAMHHANDLVRTLNGDYDGDEAAV